MGFDAQGVARSSHSRPEMAKELDKDPCGAPDVCKRGSSWSTVCEGSVFFFNDKGPRPRPGTPLSATSSVDAPLSATSAFDAAEGSAEDSLVETEVSFPGYVKTAYSTARQQFFYKTSKAKSRVALGGFALVLQVFWYNSSTGELELYIAKSLDVSKAAKHPGGLEGWQADAYHEVDVLRSLVHVPGVVRFGAVVVEGNGAMHIILPRVHGLDLSRRIRSRHWSAKGLTWRQMQVALRETAQVLSDLHSCGVVHGDIKPANIMSSSDKTTVTLIDFGAASFWDGSECKYNGGTLSYAAPELLLAARRRMPVENAPPCFTLCGPPADCWALGATAFELLTGVCLFKPAKDHKRSGMVSSSDPGSDWICQQIADLHGDWEDLAGASPIHVDFQEAMEQVAAVSEAFHQEGVNFLRSLLHPDHVQRLTAEEALQHPFLTTEFSDLALDGMPPMQKTEEYIPENSEDRAARDAMIKMIDDMLDREYAQPA